MSKCKRCIQEDKHVIELESEKAGERENLWPKAIQRLLCQNFSHKLALGWDCSHYDSKSI